MLKEPTLEKLQALRLGAMAAAWNEQQRHPDVHGMSFDERFALLVDAEWVARETKRVKRALKEAKLRLEHACLEGVECNTVRHIDRAVLRQLATCQWVEQHHSVLISGATGLVTLCSASSSFRNHSHLIVGAVKGGLAEESVQAA